MFIRIQSKLLNYVFCVCLHFSLYQRELAPKIEKKNSKLAEHPKSKQNTEAAEKTIKEEIKSEEIQ